MSDANGARGEGTVNRLSKRQSTALLGTGILVTPHAARARKHALHFALQGLFEAWKTEPNLRLHVIAGWGVMTCGVIVKLCATEWIAITIAIGIVLMAELVNTALEHTIDLVVGLRTDPLARYVKDVAAGSVLVAACVSAVIGVVVFLPHITRLIFGH